MNELPTVCILAGGRGRRLGPRVSDVPKPLLEVAGEPFLLHQLRLLARHGARRVVLCVGYLGERDYSMRAWLDAERKTSSAIASSSSTATRIYVSTTVPRSTSGAGAGASA